MIRTGLIKILVWAIIPIAFTLIFFATVDYERNGNWISLVFLWIAYLTTSITCLSKWGKQFSVLNWTMYYCAVLYFGVEILAASLFLYVYDDYPQWSFTVQLLLFVAYVLVFGFSYISNHHTSEQIKVLNANGAKVKHWRAKVAVLQLENPSVELYELSNLLSITPIISTPEVKEIDDEISSMIETDILNVPLIVKKVKERNVILKYLCN